MTGAKEALVALDTWTSDCWARVIGGRMKRSNTAAARASRVRELVMPRKTQ